MNEFTCVLNAGCYDNPAEFSAGYSGAEETVERWVTRNRCHGDPDELEPHDIEAALLGVDTNRREWNGCDRGTGVGLWTIVNGDHVPQLSLNFGSRVIEWALAHPRREVENSVTE